MMILNTPQKDTKNTNKTAKARNESSMIKNTSLVYGQCVKDRRISLLLTVNITTKAKGF